MRLEELHRLCPGFPQERRARPTRTTLQPGDIIEVMYGMDKWVRLGIVVVERNGNYTDTDWNRPAEAIAVAMFENYVPGNQIFNAFWIDPRMHAILRIVIANEAMDSGRL